MQPITQSHNPYCAHDFFPPTCTFTCRQTHSGHDIHHLSAGKHGSKCILEEGCEKALGGGLG